MITLNFSADISKKDEEEIRRYCQEEMCCELERKLEDVMMDWLEKAKTYTRDAAETRAMMEAKEDAGVVSDVPKPGDKVEITEVVEIPKEELTKEEMKARVKDWVEKIKADQKKMNKELALGEKFNTDFDSFYQIQEVVEEEANKDGAEEFLFLFDGELYEFIEHYRSDGYHKHYGEAFDALTEGTNWGQESERPGVEYFVEQ